VNELATRLQGAIATPYCIVAALVLLAGAPAPSSAQAGNPVTIDGLGTITFPVTTSSAGAERAFVRGVLLLHLFHYEEAAEAFEAAERLDPSLAMAYWGEAMTHTHGVWNDQDLDAGRAALARLGATPAARAARAATERERGYLHAVEVLYGDGPKARRDTLYADAMADLVRQYPGDDEARAFYALALLGLNQGVRDSSTYLRAAAIAESVFARNPHHPGAAHYWIHGMDDPDHATGALPAARALSEIAPDAGHAQHMTSHIFMALGMWDDVVRANENATRVVDRARAAAGRPPARCGHYLLWLEYGYLQQGRHDDAAAILDECIAASSRGDPVSLDPDNSTLGSAVAMWSHFLVDTEGWATDRAGWSPEFGSSDPPRVTWAFTSALAAARRGDDITARARFRDFGAAKARMENRLAGSTVPDEVEYQKGLAILDLELQAVVGLAEDAGSSDRALSLLRRAADLEDGLAYAFGPPVLVKPSRELLGEVLLQAGRPAEAREAFQAALRRTPRRALATRGLAQATAAIRKSDARGSP
jgi:tetratricopeptide (TPR) repeat protein